MTPDGRIDPQPVTLDVVPVALVNDKAREDGLAAANGRDLVQERVTHVVRVAAIVFALLFVIRCLCGCSELAAIGEGAKTARDVAKLGCAILNGTDGSSADVLARTQDLQRAILEADAKKAIEKGADAAQVEEDRRTIAALADTLRIVSSGIVKAAGNGPARLPACPSQP